MDPICLGQLAHGPRVTLQEIVLWLHHGHSDELQVASDKLKWGHSDLE